MIYALKKKIIRVFDLIFTPVYVISYPKAGRTWLRALLAEVLIPDLCEDIKLDLTNATRKTFKIPTIVFTHAGYTKKEALTFPNHSRRTNFVLVRDPRDIVVSSYFEHTLRSGGFDSQKSISDFLRDRVYGIESIIKFYNSILENNKKIKIIRYEDMRSDTILILEEILKDIGVNSQTFLNHVPEAVKKCEFKRMQAQAKKSKNSRLVSTDVRNPEAQKIRRGVVGGYISYLSDCDQEYVDAHMAKMNKKFGY